MVVCLGDIWDDNMQETLNQYSGLCNLDLDMALDLNLGLGLGLGLDLEPGPSWV